MTGRELAAKLAGEIADGVRAPGERLPSVRELAREARCATGTAARAFAGLRSAGIVSGRDRARHSVAADGPARARAWLATAGALRLAGSDDPALDPLLRSVGRAVATVPGPRGSVTGLVQLARGAADAATIHLRHTSGGGFNGPFLRAALAGEHGLLVHLWRREQGLLVARGNPLGIRGVGDLGGRRVAWRVPGTGSRLLLEQLLHEAGVEPGPAEGEPVDSHLEVATAVATGAAVAGLAVRAVAESAELEWIHVASEPFELALREHDRAAAGPLLDALAGASFQRQVASLPGYDLTESGRTTRVA
jgi:molybdate-binding protein